MSESLEAAKAAVDDLAASLARAEEAAAAKDDAASWKAVDAARGALSKAETRHRVLVQQDEREKRERRESDERVALEAKRAELAEAQRIRDAEVVTDADAAAFLSAAETIAALHEKFERSFASKFQADCRAAELSTELHGAGARLRAGAFPAKIGFLTILGKSVTSPRDVAIMSALADASRAYSDRRSMTSEQVRLRREVEFDKTRIEDSARDNERWNREATEEVARLEAQITSRGEYIEQRRARLAGTTDPALQKSLLESISENETKIRSLSEQLSAAREKVARTERGRLVNAERLAEVTGKLEAFQ